MKKIVLFIFLLLCVLVMVFSFTACAHRDPGAYQEGEYLFTKTSSFSDEELLFSDNNGYHIETMSMTFKKIGLSEYNKADGKNVIKNSRDLKKYHVDLFIKFAEEDEGHHYDFVFDDSVFFEHTLNVSVKNEGLGLNYDKKIVLVIEKSETAITILWFRDENTNYESNNITLTHK